MRNTIKLNNLGDTIIEVLIAIAVLSVVLGGAYSISTRSLSNVTQAQEHTTAVKYAEKQAELLKQLSDGGGDDSAGQNIFAFGTPFCVVVTGANIELKASPALCKVTPGAVEYTMAIGRTKIGSTPSHNFDIVVSWKGVRDDTRNVSFDYRLNN